MAGQIAMPGRDKTKLKIDTIDKFSNTIYKKPRGGVGRIKQEDNEQCLRVSVCVEEGGGGIRFGLE